MNHKEPLSLRPASTFFLSFFLLFCFEMSVLWGVVLILFYSVSVNRSDWEFLLPEWHVGSVERPLAATSLEHIDQEWLLASAL